MAYTPPFNLPSRRDFLAAAGAASAMALCPFNALGAVGDLRRLNLYNPRTEERLDTIYYVRGEYIAQEMIKIDRILRDLRAEKMTRTDPRLIDIVSATQYLLKLDRPIAVISGYRTPQTNAALRSKSSGVAKNSYHIRGMAMDLRVSGVPARAIDQIGNRLGAGGVGLYSGSNFVHLDSGPVRSWGS